MRETTALALCLLAVAVLSGCSNHETRSVHLPLAVGNLWQYDVESDSVLGTARLEVTGEDRGVFILSAQCTTGHWTTRKGPRYLSCRDSVLWLRDTIRGFWKDEVVWSSILSDDPGQESTQTTLIWRGPGRTRFSTHAVPELVIAGDTYRNCLALHGTYISSCLFWFIFFTGGDDSIEVEETYCPEVGLISYTKEDNWKSWWGTLGGSGGTDSGVYCDRWSLRSRSLRGR